MVVDSCFSKSYSRIHIQNDFVPTTTFKDTHFAELKMNILSTSFKDRPSYTMMILVTGISWFFHHQPSCCPILTIHQQKETSKEKCVTKNKITFHLIAGTHKTRTEPVPVHPVSVMLDAKMTKNVHFALKGLQQIHLRISTFNKNTQR